MSSLLTLSITASSSSCDTSSGKKDFLHTQHREFHSALLRPFHMKYHWGFFSHADNAQCRVDAFFLKLCYLCFNSFIQRSRNFFTKGTASAIVKALLLSILIFSSFSLPSTLSNISSAIGQDTSPAFASAFSFSCAAYSLSAIDFVLIYTFSLAPFKAALQVPHATHR